MIERENKIYIWNELHSIVVAKYKHSSISRRSPTGFDPNINIIVFRSIKHFLMLGLINALPLLQGSWPILLKIAIWK